MLVLSADTSLPTLSVALLRGDALLGAIALEGKGSRNEKLLPAVDWLLGECGVGRGDVELFAVTRGPGSFTGVRIGLATLQGFAMAMGRPLCAISTHEAIALGEGDPLHHDTGIFGRTLVFDDAGRGEFYGSVFDGGREVMPPRLMSGAEVDQLSESVVLTIPVAEFVQHANVAVGCARRAQSIARAGALEQCGDATPIYVRLAEAEVKLNERNG